MKKWLAGMLAVVMVFSMAGCGGTAEDGKEESKKGDYIAVEAGDVLDVVGNKERRIVFANNVSDQYVSGIMQVSAMGKNGEVLGETDILMQNLEPVGNSNGILLTPIGKEIKEFEIKTVWMETSKNPMASPEITEDNVKDYLYLTYVPMGSIDYGEATFNGSIHNMTTQYFSGAITYRVTDENGDVLLETTEVYENVNPGEEKAVVDGAKPADKYHVEYEVIEFEFADNPII